MQNMPGYLQYAIFILERSRVFEQKFSVNVLKTVTELGSIRFWVKTENWLSWETRKLISDKRQTTLTDVMISLHVFLRRH